jgi:hypothetical protein
MGSIVGSRRLKSLLVTSVGAAVLAAFAIEAQAGTITFTNQQLDESGTGFGNRLSLLVVQDSPAEFGSVKWGGAADVLTDDATAQSSTRRSDAIRLNAASTSFGVVLNINQGGNIVLNDFNVLRFNAAGALQETITFNAGAGVVLSTAGQGNGNSGWLFIVSGVSLAQADDRWGMEILSGEAITGATGGAESFYAASLVTGAIPLPPAAWSGLAALGAMGAMHLVRRRRSATL